MRWPKVRLGNILKQISRSEQVEATKEYRQLGIRLDGAGPYLRETKLGSQISASRLARVNRGKCKTLSDIVITNLPHYS